MFIIEKQRGNTVLPCKKPVIGNRQKISEKPVDIRKKPIYNKNVERQHNPEKSKSFLVRKSE